MAQQTACTVWLGMLTQPAGGASNRLWRAVRGESFPALMNFLPFRTGLMPGCLHNSLRNIYALPAGLLPASLGTPDRQGPSGGLTVLHKWHLPVGVDGPDQAVDCGIPAKAKASHEGADNDEPVGGKHGPPAPHPAGAQQPDTKATATLRRHMHQGQGEGESKRCRRCRRGGSAPFSIIDFDSCSLLGSLIVRASVRPPVCVQGPTPLVCHSPCLDEGCCPPGRGELVVEVEGQSRQNEAVVGPQGSTHSVTHSQPCTGKSCSGKLKWRLQRSIAHYYAPQSGWHACTYVVAGPGPLTFQR